MNPAVPPALQVFAYVRERQAISRQRTVRLERLGGEGAAGIKGRLGAPSGAAGAGAGPVFSDPGAGHGRHNARLRLPCCSAHVQRCSIPG